MSWLSIIGKSGLRARDVAALQGQAGEAAEAAADAGLYLENAAHFDGRIKQELELLWRRSDRVGKQTLREVVRLLNLKGWHEQQALAKADHAWKASAGIAQTCERHLNQEQAGRAS